MLNSVREEYCGICWKPIYTSCVGSRVRRRDFDEIIFYLFCKNFSYNENLDYRIAQDVSRNFLLKNEGII